MTAAMDEKAARAAARAAKKEATLAARAALDALPATERWALFERIGLLLHPQLFQFAKTMPQNPHYYTLRRKWANDDDFVWVVEQIRLQGYKQKYGGSWYTVLDLNGHFYWTMGWPILTLDTPGLELRGTILINRKVGTGRGPSPYDAIVPVYDSIFQNEASLAQKAYVSGIVGDLTDLEVLDVGCGTGLALDYAERAASYTGIDPAQAKLDRFLLRHPSVRTLCTALRSFVPLAPNGEIRRYDTVLALFGTASYLNDDELERIPTLLRPGGRAVTMFYDVDYVPQAFIGAGATAPHRNWSAGLFPGETEKIGHYIVCVYENP